MHGPGDLQTQNGHNVNHHFTSISGSQRFNTTMPTPAPLNTFPIQQDADLAACGPQWL